MYNKVADLGDVVTREQGFSIFETHEPAIAMRLSPVRLHTMDSYSHRNKKFLVELHQEVRRFVSHGLVYHIVSQ